MLLDDEHQFTAFSRLYFPRRLRRRAEVPFLFVSLEAHDLFGTQEIKNEPDEVF
jgi:hypothetical protein